MDGHRGRDRLHDRLPGRSWARSARSWSPATRSSATPATTPRSSTAASSPAPTFAPFATTGWTSWKRCWREPPPRAAGPLWWSMASSRWRATSATCPRSSSSAAVSARACWSTRPTASASSASGERAPASCWARGRGRSADGNVLQEPRLVRWVHRGLGGGHRVSADLRALLHLQRFGGPGRRGGRPRRPSGHQVRGVRADGAPARQRRLPAPGLPGHGAQGGRAGQPSPTGRRRQRRSSR